MGWARVCMQWCMLLPLPKLPRSSEAPTPACSCLQRQRMKLLLIAIILGTLVMTGQSLVGGFSDHADFENDAEVQSAADFAAKEIGVKLQGIKSVQKQVVAGLNYKLLLDTDGGLYDATVYKGLGNAPLKLTNHQKSSS